MKRLFLPVLVLGLSFGALNVHAAEAVPLYDQTIAKARTLMDDGKLAEAYLAASGAMTLDDSRWEAYGLLGLVLNAQGSNTEAKAYLEKALARAPEDKRAALLSVREKLNHIQVGKVPSTSEKSAVRVPPSLGNAPLNMSNLSPDQLITAATSGDPKAQSRLGIRYLKGEKGFAQNDTEAVKWCRKAAEQDDAEGQFYLGVLYATGRGMEKNEVEAVRWYRRAAEQGDAGAQAVLGAMYARGRGVEKNEVEAVKWLRKAAEQGNAKAQYLLGTMYANGFGVEKNDVEAVMWYRKAAEQGDADAQANLGWAYENGGGVQKDDVDAFNWYKKGAEQGNTYAQKALARLRPSGQPNPIPINPAQDVSSRAAAVRSTRENNVIPEQKDDEAAKMELRSLVNRIPALFRASGTFHDPHAGSMGGGSHGEKRFAIKDVTSSERGSLSWTQQEWYAPDTSVGSLSERQPSDSKCSFNLRDFDTISIADIWSDKSDSSKPGNGLDYFTVTIHLKAKSGHAKMETAEGVVLYDIPECDSFSLEVKDEASAEAIKQTFERAAALLRGRQ